MRFELQENGRGTGFVYHKGELLHEEGREEKQTSYHLGAGIDALHRGQELSYYHRDEQLSAAYITGGQGEILNSYFYDAFGAEIEVNEQFQNRIRYTGQPYDDLAGQYYLRARYYNPVLGRFMQEDVYQGDGLNLYAYCNNNPVVYYDPSGYIGLCPNALTQPGNDGSSEGGTDFNSQSPMFGEDWHRYFNETYGQENVMWESVSIQDIIDMPSKITDFSPKQIADLAQANGWSIGPLGKGSLAGVPYEQGGGFSIHAPNGGSEYIQYHPGGGHHGELPYFKISSGPNGIVRYFIGGNGQ